MPSLRILYASTSGHTEYVVGIALQTLAELFGDWLLSAQRVEQATPEDLTRADVLILASGSWNTGGIEGQMNPYMHFFLHKKANTVDLAGKPVGIIALGDDRYRFTAAAGDHLRAFVESHNGTVLEPQLRIVNEPYGQEEAVRTWASELALQAAITPPAA